MVDVTTPAVVPLTDPALLRSLHRDVLVPSFPPAELVDEQELLDAHASGRLRSLGVVEEDRVVAGVVGEWFADARVLLVLYLAIAPGRRGGGVGRRLVTTALDDWRALDPLVVVGAGGLRAGRAGGGAPPAGRPPRPCAALGRRLGAQGP